MGSNNLTNVALAGSDISINDTKMQTMKLVKLTMESRGQDASDDIGNFLQEDGTGFGGKAPNGLNVSPFQYRVLQTV